jgi:8-oxo-dGTP diphosphatase
LTGTRKHTEVAVGILIREDGALLLSTRPEGKPYAGYWEFPGGKLEAGETVEQALRRELHEELGITIAGAEAWKVTEHDYPHALVRLHFCKVRAWRGELEMREAQEARWQTLPVTVAPVLKGARPVLDWLAAERGYDGVACLGVVIRGETDHYDFVCAEAARGIQDVQLESGVPCAFGVITCDNMEQALARAGGGKRDQGRNAALTVARMAVLKRQIA